MHINWRDIALKLLLVWWRLTRPCTVGVRGLVVNEAGELLLVQHSYGGRKWFLPGGGHQGDESPDETLVREMREETGLEVVVTGLIGAYFYTGGYKRDNIYIFECQATGGQVQLVGGEISSIDWFPLDALPERLMVGMKRILADWRNGKTGFGRIEASKPGDLI